MHLAVSHTRISNIVSASVTWPSHSRRFVNVRLCRVRKEHVYFVQNETHRDVGEKRQVVTFTVYNAKKMHGKKILVTMQHSKAAY